MLLEALINSYPRVAAREFLIDAVWGNDPNGEPESALNWFSVMSVKINKKIASLVD